MKNINANGDCMVVKSVLDCTTEFEGLSENPIPVLSRNLQNMFGSYGSSPAINDGNGFNADIHKDCSVPDGNGHGRHVLPSYARNYHSFEISTSPLSVVSFKELHKELTTVINRLTQAGGRLAPTVFGSNHIHMTMMFDRSGAIITGINHQTLVNNIARILKTYFPAIRVLGAFRPDTIVRNHGTWSADYSYTSNDKLMNWNVNNNFSADRESMFRTTYLNNREFHVEFRHMDSCQSPLMLAVNMTVLRAIVLYAVNCMKYNTTPATSQNAIDRSKAVTGQLKAGIYNSTEISEMGEELISLLAPMFRLLNSPEIPELLRKMWTTPAYTVLGSLENAGNWELLDRAYLGRSRAKDESKREAFLTAIVRGSVGRKNSLGEFQTALAEVLDITEKEVKSLYVMLTREGYNLEFMEGRLSLL